MMKTVWSITKILMVLVFGIVFVLGMFTPKVTDRDLLYLILGYVLFMLCEIMEQQRGAK